VLLRGDEFGHSSWPIVSPGGYSGMFKMLLHRDDGRLLVFHCIGIRATELIHRCSHCAARAVGRDAFAAGSDHRAMVVVL